MNTDSEQSPQERTAQPERPPRRRWTRRTTVWVSTGVVALLVVAASIAVPLGITAADRANAADAARADAPTLSAAADAAQAAADRHERAQKIATAALAAARPAAKTVSAHVAEFGQDAADLLATAVADVEKVAAAGSDETGSAEAVVRLDGLGDGPIAATLEQYYLEADDRAAARHEVADEAARLRAAGERLDEDEARVRLAVENLDAAVAGAAQSGAVQGRKTLTSLPHASAKTRSALTKALGKLDAVAKAPSPQWQARTADDPLAVADGASALNGYVSGVDAARSSNKANTPPPPTTGGGGSGGGGTGGGGSGGGGSGGGGGGTCWIWGPYGSIPYRC